VWTRLSACYVDQREYFGALTIVLEENSLAGSLRPSQNCQLNFIVIDTIMFEMSYNVDKNLALISRQKTILVY
jgi:hypothetical protein